jgi:CheY-like chemotaxis protein
MPVMDGLTAARAIRELPDAQGRVHIISLTADVFSDTREALRQAGVNDFLSKPVNPDALFRALKKVGNDS